MEVTSIWHDIWTGVKWLAKACVAFIVIAAIMFPLIVLMDSEMRSRHMQVSAGLSATWVSLVGVVLALFVVYIGWRIIKALLLYPFGSWQVFGATTGTRLIALGITAIFTPRAVEKLLMVPVTLLLRLIERLTRQAQNIPMSIGQASNENVVSIEEPVIRLSVMVLEVLAEVGRVVSQAVEGLLTPEVIIAVALWVMIGNLLSAAVPGRGESTAVMGGSRLFQYVHAMSVAQRHGVVLTAVFLFGAYLSIAAIVAIPWLNEEKVSPGLSRTALEEMLSQNLPVAVQTAETINAAAAPEEDPFKDLSDFLNKEKNPAESFGSTHLLSVVLAEAKEARSKALVRLHQMPSEISQRVSQMRQAALSAFDLETATLMSNQERAYFIKEIQRSVTSDYARLDTARKNCAGTLAESDKQFLQFSKAAVSALSYQMPSTPFTDAARAAEQLRTAMLGTPIANASRQTRLLADACATPDFQLAVYYPPVAGSGWGPFGLVARWLLQTKSLALTLITGMLGFGLLGSAIATFVRADAQRDKISLTAEVTSVLVRGLSAAVVVFLAVKGGLAIFAKGDNEPNAYVVFLTCLVGAVFSEDVWAWARSKFLDNLGSKERQSMPERTMAEAMEGKSGMKKSEDAD